MPWKLKNENSLRSWIIFIGYWMNIAKYWYQIALLSLKPIVMSVNMSQYSSNKNNYIDHSIISYRESTAHRYRLTQSWDIHVVPTKVDLSTLINIMSIIAQMVRYDKTLAKLFYKFVYSSQMVLIEFSPRLSITR